MKTSTSPRTIDLDGSFLGNEETNTYPLTAEHLNDDFFVEMVLKQKGLTLTRKDIGTMVRILGKKDQQIISNTDFIHDLIKKHTHRSILEKIISLGNKRVYIHDDESLRKLLGLPKVSEGGDFRTDDPLTSLPGDLKYYDERTKGVNIGGAIRKATIIEQCEMLIFAWRMSGDKHIYRGSYINLWDTLKDSEKDLDGLLTKYNQWLEDGRPTTVDLTSKYFYITLHNSDDDRIYVKMDVINKHATEFFRIVGYKVLDKVELNLKQVLVLVSEKVETAVRGVLHEKIKLIEILDLFAKGKFFIPMFQRPVGTGADFASKYITATVMHDMQGHRGLFMFYNTAKGKIGIVDGQQRIKNAIKSFFIDKNIPLGDCVIVYKGIKYDFSNLNWAEILELAKKNDIIKEITDDIMQREFTVRYYNNYSYSEMALEFRLANSGLTMERQEIRASFKSSIGDIIRSVTTPDFRKWLKEEDGIVIDHVNFDEIFKPKSGNGGKYLKNIRIDTSHMGIDRLMSLSFNRIMNWKSGYIENEDVLDDLYNSYQDPATALKDWRKFEDYLLNVKQMIDHHTCQNYVTPKNCKPDKYHYGFAIVGKSEWDLLMFLTMELKRKYPTKKLTITKDVITYIVSRHLKWKDDANGEENRYGWEVRQGTRNYKQITEVWYPQWKNDLFDKNLTELENIGFSFK